jgi:hypothetical protein
VGMGPKEARIPNGYTFVCAPAPLCGNLGQYALDLYTDTATASGGSVSGVLQFDGSGEPVNIPTNVTYDAASRVFTIQ